MQAGEDEVRRRHARMEREATPVDPRHGPAERLGPHQVRELRLARVQDLVETHAGPLEEVAEEGAIRLVAARLLGGADEGELASESGRREEIVIDVGDDGEPVTPGQRLERGG